MSKYFKNVNSYEELKKQYRDLLKKNHPDNGGDTEATSEINIEFAALFAIWKNKKNTAKKETESKEETTETAESVKMNFYTEFGWAGSNYNRNLSLKEIAKIVRAYVKEKYPLCKFSVRTSYASMCQELHVEIKEFNGKMYKTADDLRNEGLNETHTYTDTTTGELHEWKSYTEEVNAMLKKLNANNLFNKDSWYDEELINAYEKAIEKMKFYAIQSESFKACLDDVNAFVNSYNYSDCDGMIDYFNVNFYYFDCKYESCIEVHKVARVTKKNATPAKAKKPTQDTQTTEAIEKNNKLTYTITKGEDTRDLSELWIVKVNETLSKDDYIKENKAMRERGGYYSKFKHGFIFRFDPTELLTT